MRTQGGRSRVMMGVRMSRSSADVASIRLDAVDLDGDRPGAACR